MGRAATLEPTKDLAKNLWYISYPPRLSPTGKRKREYFSSRREAEERSKCVQQEQSQTFSLLQKISPSLIKAAVTYDELFQIYGFNGLQDACEKFAADLERERESARFGELLQTFQEAHWQDWAKPTRTTWNWVRKHLRDLEEHPLSVMSTAFWSSLLKNLAGKEDWSPSTFNDVAKRISGVWRYGIRQGLAHTNPIEGVKRRKIRKTPVAILEVTQARKIMETAWEYDREMFPYFAIALFAGLRPDCELTKVTWADVNFEERWIRVNFGNKTDTKRFVPIEDNLATWLSSWKDAAGSIIPTNLLRRWRYLVRGKYQSPAGTHETKWTPICKWVRDLTRHSYGSYLEGQYKDRNTVKENMGHADFNTYQQHYRNARTPKQAKEYWAIMPPEKQNGMD